MEKEKEYKLTDRDIAAKEKGAIHAIKIHEEGKDLCLYLKAPHRSIVGLYYSKEKVNMTEARELLLRASALHEISDMQMITDDKYFYTTILDVDNYLDKIELKKSTSVSL